jgi:hypothetical protein
MLNVKMSKSKKASNLINRNIKYLKVMRNIYLY